MPDVIITLDSDRALLIARKLREINLLLPADDRSYHQRHSQLLYVAAMFENAVKDQRPELPRHERPKQRNSKMVWCRGEGCERALTREQARENPLCPECREKVKP